MGHARVAVSIAGALVGLFGCGGAPPAFPDGASGGDTTASSTAGTPNSDSSGMADGGDDTDEGPIGTGSGDGASTTGAADDAPASEDGATPGSSSGSDAGSTGTPPTNEGSTGPELPWYVGHYEGEWDGACESLPVSGNGTWSIDIDAAGQITGTYDGDFSGNIDGEVDRQGNQTAIADGRELGQCTWTGVIEQNGDTQGTFSCPYQCSGDWSGTLQ
jgi:hypothetical protein